MDHPRVTLSKQGTNHVRAGHPWVFSNQIHGSVSDLPMGGTVDVHADTGAFVGRGHANPHSLVAVRLLTRNKREDIEHPAFFSGRLREALRQRERVYPDRVSGRLVNGEGDGLPGLIIDRYGDVLEVRTLTPAMEQRQPALRAAIEDVLAPKGAVLGNDGRDRTREKMPEERKVWFGDVPELVRFEDRGLQLVGSLHQGSDPMHYFDRSDDRTALAELAHGHRVLDVYANNGAWALQMLLAGATEAVAVDKRESCCVAASDSGALSGVSDRLTVLNDEGKRTLQEMVAIGQRFGVVVLDPPPFAKAKRDIKSASRGYAEVYALAMTLLEPGGLLFAHSRSAVMTADEWEAALATAALETGRRCRLLRTGTVSSDHPGVPGVGQMRYLHASVLHLA